MESIHGYEQANRMIQTPLLLFLKNKTAIMATDVSPKSLLDHFRHLNAEEKREFIRLLRQEVLEGNFELTSEEWEAFGLSGLTEEWDRPENDFWDEEFQRQNQS